VVPLTPGSQAAARVLTRWYAFIKLHPTSAFDDS
jgi:hypothetical protein